AQRLVAVARLVVGQAPVGAVQPRIDLRIDVTVVEAGLDTGGLELLQDLRRVHACAPFRPSISWSSLSLLMKLHIVRSLTSITGESAQAPRHSLCCSVNRPSAVVSPMAMPSFFSRWCKAFWPSR